MKFTCFQCRKKLAEIAGGICKECWTPEQDERARRNYLASKPLLDSGDIAGYLALLKQQEDEARGGK